MKKRSKGKDTGSLGSKGKKGIVSKPSKTLLERLSTLPRGKLPSKTAKPVKSPSRRVKKGISSKPLEKKTKEGKLPTKVIIGKNNKTNIKKKVCIACNDTGKDSRGNLCYPCIANGRINYK